VSDSASLWAYSNQSTINRSITIAASWTLDAVVERLCVFEGSISAWRAKRNACRLSSIWAVTVLRTRNNTAICSRSVCVTAVAFRAEVTVLRVMQVSAIRESASRAFNLGCRGACSWTHVSCLAEVTLVCCHLRVRAIMLWWALVQRIQARHARERRVVSCWGWLW